MEEAIRIGDTVKVKDVRSPKMLVIDQALNDDDTVYTCLWFDDEQVARQIGLKGQFLQQTQAETAVFGTVPVLGYAR